MIACAVPDGVLDAANYFTLACTASASRHWVWRTRADAWFSLVMLVGADIKSLNARTKTAGAARDVGGQLRDGWLDCR